MNDKYNVVGVKFKKLGKIYYFNPNKINLSLGDKVVVETTKGIKCGEVVIVNKKIDKKFLLLPLKLVLRIFNDEDEKQLNQNKEDSKKAFSICIEKIKKYKLSMKLLKTEYSFDRSKIIFYFISEKRIDFRILVKELARIFKNRIELRQIGVRDQAKMTNGYGCCGRQLCCCSFLTEFDAVFIKMAKNQNLSLNPNKISGSCGRLMCCLKYEDEIYSNLKSMFPKEFSYVETPKGKAKVIKNNLFNNEVTVTFKDGGFTKYSLKDIKFEPAGVEEIIVTEEDINKIKKKELLDEIIDTN